jgi:hypothetical protein
MAVSVIFGLLFATTSTPGIVPVPYSPMFCVDFRPVATGARGGGSRGSRAPRRTRGIVA